MYSIWLVEWAGEQLGSGRFARSRAKADTPACHTGASWLSEQRSNGLFQSEEKYNVGKHNAERPEKGGILERQAVETLNKYEGIASLSQSISSTEANHASESTDNNSRCISVSFSGMLHIAFVRATLCANLRRLSESNRNGKATRKRGQSPK